MAISYDYTLFGLEKKAKMHKPIIKTGGLHRPPHCMF